MWLLICFLLLLGVSHQHSKWEGSHSLTFVSNLTWWDWKDIVWMWFSDYPVCSSSYRCPELLCSAWWDRGLKCPYFMFFCAARGYFSLLSLVRVLAVVIELPSGKGLAGEYESKNLELFEFLASSVSCGLVYWSNPYLEIERDDWALRPSCLWNSLPLWTQLCFFHPPLTKFTCSVHEVTMAALGDQRVLGGLWFGGDIRHYCRFWA